MIIFFRTVFVLMLSCLVTVHAEDRKMPVMVGGNDGLDACMSSGMVQGLKSDGDGFLAVRTGAGSQYSMTDKLTEGQTVFICDESKDQKWLGVVYDLTGQQNCDVGSPIEPKQPYHGKCKSGWVSKKWITITAG